MYTSEETTREQAVREYFQKRGIWSKQVDAEAELLRNITELVEMLGGVVVRQAHATERGVSDLLCCYCGKFVALETKAADGVASQQQEDFIKKVYKAGGIGAVVYSLKAAFLVLVAARYGADTSTISLPQAT